MRSGIPKAEKNISMNYKLSGLQEELSSRRNTWPQSQQKRLTWRKDSCSLKFASHGEKTMINVQLSYGNIENSRTKERQQYLEKLDVTHPEMYSWAEIEEKTLNELQKALGMLKAAEMLCRKIQRIELENSILIVTTEKQAKEMEALWGKRLSAGISVVEAAPRGDPGKRRREDTGTRRSQTELMKPDSELSKMRTQDNSCKMEVEKHKELYLRELRSNRALLSLFPSRTCKCPEGSSANLEEEMQWNTSPMVALVEPCPQCPQVAYLTSSSTESQGHVPHPSQSQEVICEFLENPRSWSEDKKKERERLMDSVHSLLCALRQEVRRTEVLQNELTEMKKIVNMPPEEGHGCDHRRHCFHEVSKISQTKMSIPVARLSLEGEAAAKENLVRVQANPSAAVLTRMESEIKDIESAISEAIAQERTIKRELETLKSLYRGELEHIDGMSLELRM